MRTRAQLREAFSDPEYRQEYSRAFMGTLLSKQIRALRKHRGWSRLELAERLGTSKGWVTRLEQAGYQEISRNMLDRLAEVFDIVLEVRFISYEEFLDYTSAPHLPVDLEKGPFY